MNTPQRKRAARHAPEVRRELLLQAARRCLSKNGMKGFTLQNVAGEAKVSLALIGHYFGGIDDLLRAVFDSVMFEFPPSTQEKPQDIDAATANMRAIVERNFAPDYYSRENLLVWLPIYEEMALNETLRAKLTAQDELYVDEVAQVIANVAKFRKLPVDARSLAYDFLALLDGLWIRWCHSDRTDTQREQDAAYRLLESALGPLR